MKPVAVIPAKQMIQSLDFAYYSEDNGTESTLVLNNNGRNPLEVGISFYNLDGESYRLPTRTISNQIPSRFRVSELLRSAPSGFNQGNIQVAYQGRMMQLTGQVTISDEQHHTVFESQLAGRANPRNCPVFYGVPTKAHKSF